MKNIVLLTLTGFSKDIFVSPDGDLYKVIWSFTTK